MRTIKFENLEKFQPDNIEHIDVLKKNSKYPFHTDLNMIKKFLEDTDFKGGLDIDERDYVKFVACDKFLIGISIVEDISLNDYCYLFDTFNVYFALNHSPYRLSSDLTKAWRKTLKNAYPKSTYAIDLRNHIREQKTKEIAEINEKYDNELKDL